jgi:hypothetical protein
MNLEDFPYKLAMLYLKCQIEQCTGKDLSGTIMLYVQGNLNANSR